MYLACQTELDGCERCVGGVADAELILISTYGENGSDSELVIYRKR